jgi:hypothetical protein
VTIPDVGAVMDIVWFTEGLDTPVLQEAKALLDQLSSK